MVKVLHNRLTVHRRDGGSMYASRGYDIFFSGDDGNTWRKDGTVPASLWRKAMVSFSLIRRITRSGIYGVLPLSDGSRLCIAAGMLLKAEAGSDKYLPVFKFEKGSRPLNLCSTPDGSIYWGEYFLNLLRSAPVRIFRSRDGGCTWEAAYTFSKGEICHVHRIVYDPFDSAVLVCTGDRDVESAILSTRDHFATLTPLVKGLQLYRTTTLIPLRDHILYGNDNPSAENYIVSIQRSDKSVQKLAELPGPVLYSYRVGEQAIFSTMVEKQKHEVTIWAGNAMTFRQVISFDVRKVNRTWRELVGYNTVILPEGDGDGSFLYCTPVGTKHFSDDLVALNITEE